MCVDDRDGDVVVMESRWGYGGDGIAMGMWW